MSLSPLVFDVQAKTSGAVAGFKRLATSILPVTKEADAAGKSIDKLSSKKVAPKADTAAIRNVKTEIGRLYAEISKAKALDVNADTRKAQAKIRGLQSTLRTLSAPKITPELNTTGWRAKISDALGAAKSGLQNLGGGISKVVSNIGVPVLGAIGVAVAGIGTALGVTAVKALSLADSFQRSRLQMNSFVRNMKVTDALLANIQKYADTTPFEFPELQSAARRLLGIGTAAKDIPKQLALIGNVAAQSGAQVDDLALIFSQMVSNGRVSAEDMNQLADRGVNAWGALSEATGKTVSDLRDLSSKGKLGAKEIQLLWDTLGKGAEGATDALSKTLSGQLSTLKDTLNGTLRDIGNALLPIVNSIMPGIQKGAEGFGDKIKQNLPAVVDLAAQIATAFVNLPGVVLRGLASISQGFAGMVSSVQTSLADLVNGVATALESLPAIFGDIDTSGLRDAALGLAQASIETNKTGKTAFDGLTAAADKADAATKPIAANIEKARLSAQQQIKLQMDTQAVDSKITKVKGDLAQFKQNRANATLDADKTFWDRKIAKAKDDIAKLKQTKINLQIDAEAKGLTAKINSASAKLTALGKKKSTPQVRADITKFTKSRDKAIRDLATLNVKKANPKLDANSAAFKKKVAEAERKIRAADKLKASATITADDKTGAGVRSAKSNLNSVKDKNVTIRVKTVKTKGTTADIGPQIQSMPLPPVSARYVMPAPVVTVTPQISLHLRDERLADLIDVRVDGRAARAAHVVGRRRGALL